MERARSVAIPPPHADAAPPVPKGGSGAASQAVGQYGERLAVRYLTDAGLEVIDRNWRCDLGEIDIVALETMPGGGVEVVVVEVKTRRTETFGSPVEQVTWRKAARLRKLAIRWLDAHRDVSAQSIRVDVIGVLRPRRGRAIVDHLVGVA